MLEQAHDEPSGQRAGQRQTTSAGPDRAVTAGHGEVDADESNERPGGQGCDRRDEDGGDAATCAMSRRASLPDAYRPMIRAGRPHR